MNIGGSYTGNYGTTESGTYGPGDGHGIAILNGNIYVSASATLSWIRVTGGKIYIDAGSSGVVTLSNCQGSVEIISGTVN